MDAEGLGHKVLSGIAGIFTGMVLVAIVAVLVSQRSGTTSTVQSIGTTASQILGAAEGQGITGSSGGLPGITSSGIQSQSQLPPVFG